MNLPHVTLRSPLPFILDRLERRLVEQGGAVLPDVCRGVELPATVGPGPAFWKIAEAWTTGCGGETRCAIPYDGEGDTHNVVTACAVDDAVYLWPRFMDEQEPA